MSTLGRQVGIDPDSAPLRGPDLDRFPRIGGGKPAPATRVHLDPGAVVHSMDPEEMFPYKHPAMRRVRQAFRALLVRQAGR